MGNILLKLQWVRRLLFAKNYIVLADGNSVIVIRGIKEPHLSDFLQFTSQHASLIEYRQLLDELIREHSDKVDNLVKGEAGGSQNTTN